MEVSRSIKRLSRYQTVLRRQLLRRYPTTAPLTVFEAHFMNACCRVHRCCTLLHINGYERFLKGHCGGGSVKAAATAALVPLSLSSPSHRRSSIRTWEARTRKVRGEICLILLERHSRASPIVSCILQQRNYREHRAIREIDIGLEFNSRGLTSDSLWRMI